MNLLICEVSAPSDMSPGLQYAYTHTASQRQNLINQANLLKEKKELTPTDKNHLALLEKHIKKLEQSLLEIVKKNEAMKDSSSK